MEIKVASLREPFVVPGTSISADLTLSTRADGKHVGLEMSLDKSGNFLVIKQRGVVALIPRENIKVLIAE